MSTSEAVKPESVEIDEFTGAPKRPREMAEPPDQGLVLNLDDALERNYVTFGKKRYYLKSQGDFGALEYLRLQHRAQEFNSLCQRVMELTEAEEQRFAELLGELFAAVVTMPATVAKRLTESQRMETVLAFTLVVPLRKAARESLDLMPASPEAESITAT